MGGTTWCRVIADSIRVEVSDLHAACAVGSGVMSMPE